MLKRDCIFGDLKPTFVVETEGAVAGGSETVADEESFLSVLVSSATERSSVGPDARAGDGESKFKRTTPVVALSEEEGITLFY